MRPDVIGCALVTGFGLGVIVGLVSATDLRLGLLVLLALIIAVVALVWANRRARP